MFHSWALKPDGTISERPRRFDPGTGKTSYPKACDRCRLKKVKCNGDRSGCQRCRALSRACSYSKSGKAQVQTTSNDIRARRQSRIYSGHSTDTPHDHDAGSSTEEFDYTQVTTGFSTPQIQPSLASIDSPRSSLSEQSSSESPREFTLPEMPLLPMLWASGEETGMYHDEGSTSTPFSTGFDGFAFGSGVVHETYLNPDMVALEGQSKGTINLHDSRDLNSFWSPPPWNEMDPPTHLHHAAQDHAPQYAEDRQSPPVSPRTAWDCDTTTESPGFQSSPSSSDSTYVCQCLRRTIHLMDEVEDKLQADPTRNDTMPGLMLAALKEALSHIRSTLGCPRCTGSVENTTLLTFLVANLSCLCQSLSKLLKTADRPSRPQGFANGEIDSQGNILFRSYAIDTVVEYRTVVGGLLTLKIGELNLLIEQLLDIAVEPEANGMVRRLTLAKAMLERVGHHPIRSYASVGRSVSIS